MDNLTSQVLTHQQVRPRLLAIASSLTSAITLVLTSCSTEPSTEESTSAPKSSPTEFVPASSKGPAQNVPKPEFTSELQELTVEDAETALRHWWDAQDYLRLTGDAQELRKFSASECWLCEDTANSWELHYADGGWADVEDFTLEVSVGEVFEEDNNVFLEFTLNEYPGEAYDQDGELISAQSLDKETSSTWRAVLYLDPHYRDWVVEEIGSFD